MKSMDYHGLAEDVWAIATKAGRIADQVRMADPSASIRMNIFYRECFEFYQDLRDLKRIP